MLSQYLFYKLINLFHIFLMLKFMLVFYLLQNSLFPIQYKILQFETAIFKKMLANLILYFHFLLKALLTIFLFFKYSFIFFIISTNLFPIIFYFNGVKIFIDRKFVAYFYWLTLYSAFFILYSIFSMQFQHNKHRNFFSNSNVNQ